jgi:outer membrane beta-barrel protein
MLLACLSLLVTPLLVPAAHAEDAPPPLDERFLVQVVAQDDSGDTSGTSGDESSGDDEDAPEDSVKAEKDAVRKGDTTTALPEDAKGRRRVIKTIQKKYFMKIGRFEAGPGLGFVANDPFLNRYIVHGVFDYHLTEVFAIEAQLGYSPILGSGGENDPDWKQLSKQLLLKNSVSPDISKLDAHGHIALAYSPIYGKAAVGHRIIAFDIYGSFGLGFVHTTDDLLALQAEGEQSAIDTQDQVHPTTVIGAGARVAFSPSVAVRVEGKSMSYIETVNSTTLEMKNNFIFEGTVSFFFPNMK